MKKRSPGRWLFGGALMLLGSVMVQFTMRLDAPIGARIWFGFTAALGAAAVVWGPAGLMRRTPWAAPTK